MVIRRGEIWWAELPEPEGSGPGFRRPVVVIQSDAFNRSLIDTAVVVAITSNLRLAGLPGNVRLSERDSKLAKESVVNVSHLFTLDRSLLSERVHRLPARLLKRIDAGLRFVLSL